MHAIREVMSGGAVLTPKVASKVMRAMSEQSPPVSATGVARIMSKLGATSRTEAIRTAMAKYGNEVMSGEQVRWGFENLDLTAARLGELGLEGFTKPIKLSCSDHEGNGPVLIQQWDGSKWNMVSDWITPMREVVRPMIEAAAAKYAKENGITPRDCSAE